MVPAVFKAHNLALLSVALAAGVALALSSQFILFRSEALIESKKVNFAVPKNRIKEKILSNGLRIVAYQDSRVPKVRVQMAYDVGSSIEASHEKGLAHLVEHMIFKGTMNASGEIGLSESDIDSIARKYGAQYNAYTSHDVTSYYFEADKASWQPFVGIFADCMENARFDGQHLASELQAVVQELNKNRDDYLSHALDKIFELNFPGNHPYHFPIIGFKEELATLKVEDLKAFYKRYYHPSKATLFIAGDIDLESAVDFASGHFDHMVNPEQTYSPSFPPAISDLEVSSLKMYREVNKQQDLFYWKMPGNNADIGPLAEVASDVFAGCVGARLYTRLIDDEKLAESVWSDSVVMHNAGIFLLGITAKEGMSARCEEVLIEELAKISRDGITEKELQKSTSDKVVRFFRGMEKAGNLVYQWVDDYLITKDPYSVFYYPEKIYAITPQVVQQFFAQHLKSFDMGKVSILPMGEDVEKRDAWLASSVLFEEQKKQILQNHVRTAPLEDPVFSLTLPDAKTFDHDFPQLEEVGDINGLKVITHFDDSDPLVKVSVSLKELDSLATRKESILIGLMCTMLLEGSTGHTKQENIDFLDLLGTNYSFGPNSEFLVLNVNLAPALRRFMHILKNPNFRKDALEKQKEISIAALMNKKDDQLKIAFRQLIQTMHKGTEFDWSFDDAIAVVKNCTVKDIVDLHAKYFNPANFMIGLAGNYDYAIFEEEVKLALNNWKGNVVQRSAESVPTMPEGQEHIDIKMLRDQVVFLLGAPSSINAYHPDRVALSLANTIVFESLGSRLFQLRERSGLFYGASGGFPFEIGRENGLSLVYTKLNADRLEEGEVGIKQVFTDVISGGITELELREAKQALFTSLLSLSCTKGSVLSALMRIDDFGFEKDHYHQMWKQAQALTVDDINKVIKKHYTDQLLRIRVGNF